MEAMYDGMWQTFFEIDTEEFVPRSLAKYVLPLLGIPTKNDIFIIYIITQLCSIVNSEFASSIFADASEILF